MKFQINNQANPTKPEEICSEAIKVATSREKQMLWIPKKQRNPNLSRICLSMHKYTIDYCSNFQTVVCIPQLRPCSPRNISVLSGLQIVFLSYLLIKLLSPYIVVIIPDISRLLIWTFTVSAEDNASEQKVCEKDAVTEHGQKCMGILVTFHKESLDWKEGNGKRKQKERAPRWKKKSTKKTQTKTPLLHYINVIQLHKQYIYQIKQLWVCKYSWYLFFHPCMNCWYEKIFVLSSNVMLHGPSILA